MGPPERDAGAGGAHRAHRLAPCAYLAAMGLLTAGYYLRADWRATAWALIGTLSVLAIAAGVVAHRPARPLPWILLAAAVAVFGLTDLVENVLSTAPDTEASFPTAGDTAALLAYPLAAGGFLLFVRRRHDARDWSGMLDALTVTAGLALLAWTYLIAPAVEGGGRSEISRAVSTAYPVGDVVLLAVLARLLAGSRPPPALWLLTAGTVGLLTSDVMFELGVLRGTVREGTAVDLGWIVFYTAWGAAGLHPSMAEIPERTRPRPAEIPLVGLVLLAAASLVAPAVLLAGAVQGRVRQGTVIAVFSALSFLLVLTRLTVVLRGYRGAVARERALRIAGASLVAASTLEEVSEALGLAGAMLFAPDSPGRILVLEDPGRIPRDALARPLPARRLPPWIARALGPLPYALVLTLTARRGDQRETVENALVAGGGEEELDALLDALEILAGQTAMALARVDLGQQLNRRGNEAYFRTLVHNATDVIMIVDEDTRIRYASPSAEAMFPGQRLTGVALTDLVAPGHLDPVRAALARTAPPGPADWAMRRADGTVIAVEARSDDLRSDETVGGLVLTLRDVTGQRRMEDDLRHYAYTDPLTGLPNRRQIQDRIEQAITRARDRGTTAYLILLDLDDFKDINDTKGHGVGDSLLAAVAERLRAVVRPGDVAARLGGDEFTVLLQDAAGPGDADALAERLTRAFDAPFLLPDGPVAIAASVGTASSAQSGGAEELLRNADLALYAAKADGKRRWRRYEHALHDSAVERSVLRESLADAIAREAIAPHYQPVVELGDGRVSGFEALARWPHAARAAITPEQFVSLAEDTGQIMPLGRLLLRRAVADAAAWNRRGARTPPLTIAVNVSIHQFRDPSFADDVAAVLRETGLPAGLLVLELTESALMRRHDQQALETLALLKDRGIRIAIDDFGTGYSSLSYLRDLPIDLLKIDKSFIDGVTASREQAALVEGIIRIADALELDVVAEGVETRDQWDMLGATDCAYGQGFLFGRAMPAERVVALLREHRDPRLPLEPAPAPAGDRP
jgi:diguanylate cyclase (GGDEF)-like protein/PAS domain S-box-containing protein